MIPFILAAVGGYLLGDSMKDSQKFADGGMIGKRVRLIKMNDDPNPVTPGTMGTITNVGYGVINVEWDDGRYLGLVEGVDDYEITMADGGNVDMDGGNVDMDGAVRLADNPNWTNEKLKEELENSKSNLEKLNSGELKPSKIVGGGYKSSSVAKRIAKEWLQGQITKYAKALKIREIRDGDKMADGGEIKQFDRHKQMDSETRGEILDVINEFYLIEGFDRMRNYLYGLFDGYDYSDTESFKEQMTKLKSANAEIYNRVKAIYSKIDKYEKFAKGGKTKDMSIQFIDYKDKTIMFEPHFKQYYTNDVEFKTLAQAKEYIDAGSPDPSWEKFVYAQGLMAKGGSVMKGHRGAKS